jgi:DNA-binding NarL/FixJ family response regulator
MRVLLVDDHAVFRAGLASLLRAWGFQVIGQAGNGDDAISQARILRPELIFMDIVMPGRNGLEATRAIKAESPDVKIVMLTVSDDDQDLFEAVKSGADGYLLKNLPEEEFTRLVERIRIGEPAMSAELAKKILREFGRIAQTSEMDRSDPLLTDREREVLEHVARGATNREIATALIISENTVNFHVRNILSKLHVRNRSQVVAWAAKHGLIPPEDEVDLRAT